MPDAFYADLAEALDVDTVEADAVLEELDEWDSLGVLSVIAMVGAQHGVTLHARDLEGVRTASDLAALVAGRKAG